VRILSSDLADGEMKDVTLVEAHAYNREHSTGTGVIQLHKINVYRGMTWEEAERKYKNRELSDEEGFYRSTGVRRIQIFLNSQLRRKVLT